MFSRPWQLIPSVKRCPTAPGAPSVCNLNYLHSLICCGRKTDKRTEPMIVRSAECYRRRVAHLSTVCRAWSGQLAPSPDLYSNNHRLARKSLVLTFVHYNWLNCVTQRGQVFDRRVPWRQEAR